MHGGRRGGPAWTTYHLTELMHRIESTYRIRPGRQWHSLLGISMGGQGALRYAALRPDYFGSVAALSAAMPDTQSLLFQGGLGAIILLGGAPDGVEYSAVWGSPAGAYAEGNSPQALIANLEHTRVFLSSGNGINCPGDPTNGPDGCERAATLPFEITVADWCLSDEPTSTTTPAPSAPATGAPERGRLPATGTDPGAPTVAAIVTMFVLAVRLRWQRPSVSASRRKGVT